MIVNKEIVKDLRALDLLNKLEKHVENQNRLGISVTITQLKKLGWEIQILKDFKEDSKTSSNLIEQ